MGLYKEIFKVDSIARQEGYIIHDDPVHKDRQKIIIELKNEFDYQRLAHVLDDLSIKWRTNKPASRYNPFILENNPIKRLQPDGTSVLLMIFSTGKMCFGYSHLNEIITKSNQYKAYSVSDFLTMFYFIANPNTVAKKKTVTLTDPKFLTNN